MIISTKISNIANEYAEIFLKSLVNKEYIPHNPVVIEKALRRIRMQIDINDAEARISQYCAEFFKCSKRGGYGYTVFRSENPEQEGKPPLKDVSSTHLKEEIQSFTKKNSKVYI